MYKPGSMKNSVMIMEISMLAMSTFLVRDSRFMTLLFWFLFLSVCVCVELEPVEVCIL